MKIIFFSVGRKRFIEHGSDTFEEWKESKEGISGKNFECLKKELSI